MSDLDALEEAMQEEFRQSELVRSLGQVECSQVYRHRDYEPCPRCGAAV